MIGWNVLTTTLPAITHLRQSSRPDKPPRSTGQQSFQSQQVWHKHALDRTFLVRHQSPLPGSKGWSGDDEHWSKIAVVANLHQGIVLMVKLKLPKAAPDLGMPS